MKLRITQDKKGLFYIEEDVGVKKLFREYVPDWQTYRKIYYSTVESLIGYECILHYETDRNDNSFKTKEEAIEYAKKIWSAYSVEDKERLKAAQKKANERVVVLVLDFYFDEETGNLEVREV
jgi:hypothetical protein